jgi:hypothetical protein
LDFTRVAGGLQASQYAARTYLPRLQAALTSRQSSDDAVVAALAQEEAEISDLLNKVYNGHPL